MTVNRVRYVMGPLNDPRPIPEGRKFVPGIYRQRFLIDDREGLNVETFIDKIQTRYKVVSSKRRAKAAEIEIESMTYLSSSDICRLVGRQVALVESINWIRSMWYYDNWTRWYYDN